MFTKTLFGKTKDTLALLGRSHLLDKAYLGGETACALHLGHRISVDFDFFTPKEFNAKESIKSLKKMSEFELEQHSWGTILGLMEGIRFSLFVYKYPVLFPCKSILKVNIADLRDIAAMKIDAIAARGRKRDFIDLYFICKEKIPLERALFFYNRKYGKLSSNIIHIQKSLVYFVDAEISPMPKMLKPCRWEEVKRFFEREVKRIANEKNLGQ